MRTFDDIASIPAAKTAPQQRGLARDAVRLMVSTPDGDRHLRFSDLASVLRPGDLVVANSSATRKAAVDASDGPLTVHLSTRLQSGRWIVEFRTGRGRRPHRGVAPTRIMLRGEVTLRLHGRFNDDVPARLWTASLEGVDDVDDWLAEHGRWIRYAYADEARQKNHWFQTIFAAHPGSAEMPSAGRPFTRRVLGDLRDRGVKVATLLLHCGVSSQEAGESPHPERYVVPGDTWEAVCRTKAGGGRVLAVGTTVVRALETVARGHGHEGLTDLVITSDHHVETVDGVLSGFHPPDASHLELLRAVAGGDVVSRSYQTASRHTYLSHEFGDAHLLWADDKRGPRDTMVT